ncbi:helix-turn-helix protein [Donghicola tyrosinivorans]|uniref:Helix-turn-helix protein n=2 Tax=Donghicola tyrosinivorans TaxID=1652492 RepID=A0A2T0WXN1_9RHOB|nr:helix-turn-helix protein [Donghicola tyrosinivorans]
MTSAMTDNSTPPETEVLSLLPARLRAARRDQGLSLDAVAKLSGVSRSMVSQIERGESSPTIATLWNLTRALQVDFAGLLEGATDAPGIEVLRDASVPTINNKGQGCSIRILSPPEEVGRHEVYDIRFAEGGILDSDPHKRGSREHLTVISGIVRLKAGTQVELLKAGDTARYPVDQPHTISAETGPAQVFLVVQDG